MTSLVKLLRVKTLWLKKTPYSMTFVRNHWNKDYKPLPYPQTLEEKAVSAARYGIPLKEYDPYPDDGTGDGDYPKFPMESAESRDPNYPWDFPELKRNFNEPLHVEFDAIREDRFDINQRPRKSLLVCFLEFASMMGGMTLLFWLGEHVKAFHPWTPPQIPKEGKIYYTFEQP